jgi:hypothetical protein
MEADALTINQIITNVSRLVPVYMQNEEDSKKAGGGTAVCIIDKDGNVYGKMFGTDKIMMRERYRIAWIKASQVWITGVKTGEFEKRVFNNEIDELEFGIRRPDFIGWEGGQPVILKSGNVIASAFSGFRSLTDLDIILKAVEMIEQ